MDAANTCYYNKVYAMLAMHRDFWFEIVIESYLQESRW